MPVALENGVRFHGHENIEIAGRTAIQSGLSFAAETDPRPFLDAGRNVDGKRPLLLHLAGAAARLARIAHDAACSAAVRTRPFDSEKSLLSAHLAHAAAGAALLG